MKKLYLFIVCICLAGISMGQLTVTTNVSNASICAGGSYTITASVTPSTVDPIIYSWSPATGLNTTTGSTVVASPSATTTYTVTATNTVTSQTGSNTVTISIAPASFTLAGSPGAGQVCQNINIGSGTTYRDAGCKLISSIQPAGASPVTGSINTCVMVDTGASKMGSLDLYVARRYDIEPATNPSSSTANITLYYLQSEFDNYNRKSQDSGLYNVPTGPNDSAGLADMRIRQFHGTGTGPGLYSGGRQDFKSTSAGVIIFWNAARNWWEITVPVTSFSGFYISSRKGAFSTVPITLEYFKGAQVDKKNKVYWKANCSSSQVVFEIERSENGQGFTSIGNISATQARCSAPFDFTDTAPLYGRNYYRLKTIDADGKYTYSNTVLLTSRYRKFELMGMNPNIIGNENAVVKINSEEKNEIVISVTDMTGRRIEHQTVKLHAGINAVNINTAILTQGGYMLGAYMAGEEPQTIQFIKQ